MGRTMRWLQAIFSGSTSRSKDCGHDPTPRKKKGWSFSGRRGMSYREKKKPIFQKADEVAEEEESKRAIAVAAATAAVAEAAVAAAEAAAAVVRLTSKGGRSCVDFHENRTEVRASVKIQSAFRGYLARRALRALKGLVKIQALVRGYIVRKQAADYLRCMQSLVRAQTRARAGRILRDVPSHGNLHGPAKHERKESLIPAKSAKSERHNTHKRNESRVKRHGSVKERVMQSPDWNWLDRWMEERYLECEDEEEEEEEKILEVDAGGPKIKAKWRNRPHSVCFSHQSSSILAAAQESPSKDSTTAQHSGSSVEEVEKHSSSPLGFPSQEADSSYSACTRLGGGATKSECSWSYLSGFSEHPNYMSNTQSSRAKSRSLSAPRQRPEHEKNLSAGRRNQVGGYGPFSSSQRLFSLRLKFAGKAYPGSGRLDRMGLGVPAKI